MNNMNYMDFRKKLAGDAAFRAKFDGCKTLEALIEAAAREGYSFTADEVRNNTELLPEELTTAAGGLLVCPAYDWVAYNGAIYV